MNQRVDCASFQPISCLLFRSQWMVFPVVSSVSSVRFTQTSTNSHWCDWLRKWEETHRLASWNWPAMTCYHGDKSSILERGSIEPCGAPSVPRSYNAASKYRVWGWRQRCFCEWSEVSANRCRRLWLFGLTCENTNAVGVDERNEWAHFCK